MRELDGIDLSAIDWSRLTPGQQVHLKDRIIAQARVDRARAVRALLRGMLHLPRRAAVAIAAGWRAGVRRYQRRRAMRELGALDDRMLRDLGLNRSEILMAVSGQRLEPIPLAERQRTSQQRIPVTMTPDQARLIKESWILAAANADAAVETFYNRLFEIDPTTRPLFRATGMPEQRRKIIQALSLAVQNVDQLDALTPVLENLGRGHHGHGVTRAQYESVGKALIWTLERGLGAAWTPATAAAWTELYGRLSAVMLRAADEMPRDKAA